MDSELTLPQPQRPFSLAVSRLGCLLPPLFLVMIPLAWAFAVPIELTVLGYCLYALAALAVCALVATGGRLPVRSSLRFRAVLLGLAVSMGMCLLPYALLKTAAEGFVVTSTVAESRSPDGHLAATIRYYDEGAMGGSASACVEGRLIPGLARWHYELAVEDYFEHVWWADEDTVVVDGQQYRIPVAIGVLHW